jgi:hypothetical protein
MMERVVVNDLKWGGAGRRVVWWWRVLEWSGVEEGFEK